MVDTSALLAILQGEAQAEGCRHIIADASELLIAAPTLTEALVVAFGRNLHGEMANLVASLETKVMPLTQSLAYSAVRAYRDWGKGAHPASLNICDVFAYALAKEHDCPLLFVGNDFALTDVTPALA